MKKSLILIVEDEAPIRDMVKFALSAAAFDIMEAEQVYQAEKLMADRLPDLILLDWMLPGKSGIEFAKQLKSKPLTEEIPIIMLTAKAEEENKIIGLETGADDYITKPFSPRELIARIKTVLRRGPLVTPEGKIQIKDLILNVHTSEATIENKTLKLTPMEYELLHFFMLHKDRAYSREHILNHVWGANVYIDERTVDVQIRRLRKVLNQYGYDHLIQTIRGRGYKFSENI